MLIRPARDYQALKRMRRRAMLKQVMAVAVPAVGLLLLVGAFWVLCILL